MYIIVLVNDLKKSVYCYGYILIMISGWKDIRYVFVKKKKKIFGDK